jgi:hypothetical protein
MAIFEWEGDPRTMNSATVHNLGIPHHVKTLENEEV